jgi:Sulfatase
MLLMDEFPTTSIMGRHGRIDVLRFPNFASLARDATWYRNATTVSDNTDSAVPAIMEGRTPRDRRGGLRRARRGILEVLAAHGYRVHGSAEALNICARRFCGPPRPTRYYLNRQRVGRLRQWIESISPSRQPTVWFKHTLLPHVPWIYLPSGKQYTRGVVTPIRGLNREVGVGDPVLHRLSYERHMLQVAAIDRLLGELLDRLKRTGLYDRALIVLVADEGISFRLGERDKRVVTPANVQGVAPVPLFIKRPYQRRGRISRVYARTTDVAPTIAQIVGAHIPWRTSGTSLLSRAPARRDYVRMLSRSPKRPVVRLRAGAFRAKWRRAIRYMHSLFGLDSLDGLYRVGPLEQVIGRPLSGTGTGLRVGTAPVSPPGRYQASVLRAFELQRVSEQGGFLPAFVSGHIQGGRERRTRALAIAVNGRIVATTRSFFLGRSRREDYAVIVPESSLQPGRNRVDVLAVARGGGGLRFRLLAEV